MNESIIWYQLWAPLVNVNPIFSIHVGKISKLSQDSWFYFTKQVSLWMRDDSLWANVSKVWFFQGPFSAISCSWNLLFPCARSLWSTVACRWIPLSPFKTSTPWTGPAKPWPRYQRDDHSWIWYGKNVNILLSPAISIFWEDPAKCLTPIWVLTCLALGEPSLQLATCYPQTNPSNLLPTNKP